MRAGAIAVALLAGLLCGCGRPQPLDVLGTVPEFELVSQTGQPFDGRSLDGHVWVADFIYTACTGPCPMMSARMRQVQESTSGLPDVRLVSITVDPAHDTPAVLAEYAKSFKQDPARWFFLTGDQTGLDRLGAGGLKLNSVDGSLSHSTRFVLVDRRRRIRGYYITGEEGFMPRLLSDIRQLERERS